LSIGQGDAERDPRAARGRVSCWRRPLRGATIATVRVMRRIEAEVEIEAPAERVWAVLTDFGAYPQWNPFMAEVHGEARVGATLRARLAAPRAPRLHVRLRVTKVDPPHELRWTGTRGLVRGERVITITPQGDDHVHLAQHTDFAGPLVSLLSFLDRYEPAMAAMNAALRKRAEAPDPPAALSARKAHALALFSGLEREYDILGVLMSFGQDPRWRREVVANIRAGPDDAVLDVATGTGLVARELVRRHGCHVVGLDQSEQMLAAARARLARDRQLASRTELVRGDAERLPFADGEFSALTFTYLLRYVDDPQTTLRELARVVRPGGTIAGLEFGLPDWPLRAPWMLYTRAGLPLLGRVVSREWYAVGRFLGPSIASFYGEHPLTLLPELWRKAGIGAVEMRRMSFGAGVVMWGVRSDDRP
jgi:demethylmenaquinone methyltransferase / 2-methoxy-6-polyprenyl-1,4-benzoquinol methylase